jgi:hypothetical protein
VDDVNWSVVNEAFQNGSSAVINPTRLKERFSAAAASDRKAMPLANPANDNTKDDTINAETLLGMNFAPLEHVIPGYVVEGLTVLAGKPKLVTSITPVIGITRVTGVYQPGVK